MKKRLMTRILSVVLIVLFFTVNGGIEPKVAQATTNVFLCEVDGVMWRYSIDYLGEAVYVEPADTTEMRENGTITSIIIPESLDGKKVAYINSNAFNNCTNLTSITIPESVIIIGMDAFNKCDSLTSITIPKNVTQMLYAFDNTASLKEILVSEDNQEYTSVNGVLHDKNKNVLIRYPEGKEEANYKILDSVTRIGEKAFDNCKKLSNIDIPDRVTSIEEYAFLDCENLTNITMPKDITSIDRYLFYGCYRLASITIPQKVTSIGESAFSGCDALSSIIIPDEVTSIGRYAFFNCRRLPSITIPGKVTSIGCAAFASGNLKEILVSNDNTRFESVNGVLYNKEKTRIIAYPSGKYDKNYNILESITGIGDGAFYQCPNLTSIIIPKGVTSIGREAFCDCSNLESIIIPEGVTSIGQEAFYLCWGLESIIIPEGVTSIGESAFYYCLGLESIIIPEGINKIEYGTFDYCQNLKSIIIPEGVTSIEDYAFRYCVSLNYISVPSSVSFISDSVLYGGKDNLTIYADINSYASEFKWGNNVVIDTNIGYISEKVKDDAKAKLLEGKNALLKFVNDGGLSTDNLFINLNTEISNYSTTELIDNETDLKALKLWISNLDEKIKALNFEVNTFTTGVASPQIIGTEITLTTESNGGVGTVQTKYDVYDGVSWTVLKDYSSEVTAIWKPQKAGIYKINSTVKDGTGIKIVKSLDYTINNPLIISSFNANVASPQTVGTKITLTTRSSGGAGIVQTKIVLIDGLNWTTIKNFGVEGSAFWTPTKAGSYILYTDVKDETGKVVRKTLKYVINELLTISEFTVNVASPQELGKAITLSSTASGGIGTIQTRFTIFDGSKLEVMKDYSAQGNTVWTPTKAGSYTVYADVKDETGRIVTKTLNYVITTPLTISSINANVASPQTLGTGVTLSATGTGEGTLKYKFIAVNGAVTTVIKESSESNTVVWTSIKEGTYTIKVEITDSTGKVVEKTLDYVINPAIKINSFTTNVLSPQTLGTEITLTAQSSGGTGILRTRFTIKDGLTSQIIKDYSVEGSTVVWTPTKAGTYKVYAGVKDETGKGITKSFDYVINPIKYSCEVDGIVWNYEINDTDNPVNAFNVYPSDKTLTSVKIPSTLDGKKVISIKESAFLNFVNLSSISIPEGVTSIGKETFKDCTSLEKISIPSSVTNIDSTAFENCVKLTTIYTDSGSYVSSYNWANGAVDTNIGYNRGSLIIELGDYDTNSDSVVNIIDLANVAKNYNSSKSDTNWQEKYDYNYDGIIDLYDLVKISKKIN